MTTYRKMLSDTGDELEFASVANAGYRWVKKGTTQPANAMRMVYSVDPPSTNDRFNYRHQWWERYAMGGVAFAMGLVGGLLLVVFIWHWPRRRYPWMMLLPAAVATFMAIMFAYDDQFQLIGRWSVQTVFVIAGVEALGILVGIKIGRPIARLLLRMFVPVKPRQHFNFLWRVDGKTPTSPKPV
jgi:hypothetical protein